MGMIIGYDLIISTAFYEIVDEHISTNVEGHIDIIAKAMDAFYSNSDNANISVMEAIRIVSMVQDEKE